MRVACVLITHLRAKAEMRRQAEVAEGAAHGEEEGEARSEERGDPLQAASAASSSAGHLGEPATLVVEGGGASGARPVVVDYFPGNCRVKAGMTLEQAVSQQAETVVLRADEPYYRQIFGELLRSLQGVSDRVEGAELGTAYVRLDGLEAMYGDEAGLLDALLAAVPADLNARIGVADAKFPAFVAARTREAGVSYAPEEVRGFLAPYSVELLPVCVEVKERLRRFGLHTMGDVAAMERHLIVAQFGAEGGRLWALCNGEDERPVVPLAFEESIVEHSSLPFNSSSLELLFVAVDTLLRRGYARAELDGRYVGAVGLACSARGWPPWAASIAFKQPVGRWERAAALVRDRLELEPPQIPVEDVTLTLSGFSGGSGEQMGLFQDVKERAGRRLMEMEKRLQVRMNGRHVLHRIAEVAPWHPAPEMRALQIPIDPAKRDDIRPLHAPAAVAVQEGSGGQPAAVQIGRRWRRVTGIAERWRFDLWWLPQPIRRAYFRVESEEGPVTLFRDEGAGGWYRQNGGF
ncbi:MAG: hypothetical protein OXO48_09775 [Caldilineaceae bacterium]|nr:hypothetical protein [Caldilineaceae bacterium]